MRTLVLITFPKSLDEGDEYEPLPRNKQRAPRAGMRITWKPVGNTKYTWVTPGWPKGKGSRTQENSDGPQEQEAKEIYQGKHEPMEGKGPKDKKPRKGKEPRTKEGKEAKRNVMNSPPYSRRKVVDPWIYHLPQIFGRR